MSAFVFGAFVGWVSCTMCMTLFVACIEVGAARRERAAAGTDKDDDNG